MKFNLSSIVASVALLAVPALGQRARLSYPHDGTTVHAGSNLVVEVDRPVCSFDNDALAFRTFLIFTL